MAFTELQVMKSCVARNAHEVIEPGGDITPGGRCLISVLKLLENLPEHACEALDLVSSPNVPILIFHERVLHVLSLSDASLAGNSMVVDISDCILAFSIHHP
jgi:hypothetical protein